MRIAVIYMKLICGKHLSALDPLSPACDIRPCGARPRSAGKHPDTFGPGYLFDLRMIPPSNRRPSVRIMPQGSKGLPMEGVILDFVFVVIGAAAFAGTALYLDGCASL
jgi:hypothetical protein